MKNLLNKAMLINRSIFAVVAATTLLLTACESSDEWSPFISKATIDYTAIGWNETSLSGKTSGAPGLTWKAMITEGSEWCSFSASSEKITATGAVGSSFKVYCTKNESTETRSAMVSIKFSDGYSITLPFDQLGKSENATYDRAWVEQPAEKSGESLIHKTYYTTLSNGKRVRNYSVCYDTDKKCSRWVAYPAHAIYTNGRNYTVGGPTEGRTNAWAYDDAVTQYKESSDWNTAFEILSTYVSELDTYDTYTLPIIPQKKQANISRNIGGGYARGHMLPSADRYNTWNTNAQTCYSTNIMAQQYDFNSGSWGTLENKVRNKVCADTLFVVVGTLFENSTTVSNSNGKVAVPSHCFKLLLRTKVGETDEGKPKIRIQDITSANDLMCIGFIFENNKAAASASLSSAVVSVAEIEERSGFKFFQNLNPAIAAEVKKQKNYSAWGF